MAVAHALNVIRCRFMHPMVLYNQLQLCLIIEAPDGDYLVKDAAVMSTYAEDMRELLNDLSWHAKYIFDRQRNGVFALRYRGLYVVLPRKFIYDDRYKICTLDSLPFSVEANKLISEHARYFLREHRMEVIF